MDNEKMMILKMLEEGKISADEAARLMSAAGAGKAPGGSFKRERPENFNQRAQGENANYGEHYHSRESHGRGGSSNGPNPYGQSGGFDDFASELGRKFDTFAKDMEPRLQKFTDTVVEKTASFADSISKTLSQPEATTARGERAYEQKNYGGYPPKSNPSERTFEVLVSPGYCELNLKGFNGDVVINGYNGDKITAKINCAPKFNMAPMELMKFGDRYYLNYEEADFQYVTVDAYVPDKMFKNVKIETNNGRILLSSVTADVIAVTGANAKCELKHILAGNLTLDTTNGDVRITNASGKFAKIDVFNGPANITSFDFENFSMFSSNAPVVLNIDYLKAYWDYTWVVEAANGKLVMNMPSSPELGYYVKAKTSLDTVKLGMVSMNYLANNPNYIEANSFGYENAKRKFRLSAETSNAPLSIN